MADQNTTGAIPPVAPSTTKYSVTSDAYIAQWEKTSAEKKALLQQPEFRARVEESVAEREVSGTAVFHLVRCVIIGAAPLADLPLYLRDSLLLDETLAHEIAFELYNKVLATLPEFADEARRLADETHEKIKGMKEAAALEAKEGSFDNPSTRLRGTLLRMTGEGEDLSSEAPTGVGAKEEKKRTVEDVLAEIREALESQILGVKQLDTRLQSRFLRVIEAQVKEVRDEAETKEMLIKGVKTGGLGFSAEDSEKIVVSVRPFVGKVVEEKVQVRSSQDLPSPLLSKEGNGRPHPWPSPPEINSGQVAGRGENRLPPLDKGRAGLPAMQAPQSGALRAGGVSVEKKDPPKPLLVKEGKAGVPADLIDLEEQRELAHLKRKMDKEIIKGLSKSELDQINSLTEKIIKESGLAFSDPDAQKRFKSIVDARIRDLRDARETRALVIASVEKGGLGLAPDAAEKFLNYLEGEVVQLYTSWAAAATHAAREYAHRQAEDRARREREGEERLEKELEARHKTLLKKVGVEMAPQGQLTKSKEQLTRNKEQDRIEGNNEFSPLDKGRVGLPAMQAPQSGALRAGGVSSIRAPQDLPSPLFSKEGNRPVAPVVSTATSDDIHKLAAIPAEQKPETIVAPELQTSRPPVADIKHVPKLLDAVGELKSYTIDDFRRLARDPKDATAKIKSKIERLSEESFSRKTQGIAAWRQSEVMTVYRSIVQESVAEGRPPVQIGISRKERSEQTLTEAELEALVALNQELRG